ncbi:MAG: hypothetical protein U5R31_08910 [Acidimicrobiia bacterium]|nr:hypothetical protein [Acidimicrobiia bacterium]
MHFGELGRDSRYEAYLFDIGTLSFDSRSLIGFLVFHLLNLHSHPGDQRVVLFLVRRLRDPRSPWSSRGARARRSLPPSLHRTHAGGWSLAGGRCPASSTVHALGG